MSSDGSTAPMADYFAFLDELRKSGVTNMYGAGSYLEDEFSELTRKEAGKIVLLWMETFDPKIEPKDRAKSALGSC